MTQHPEPDIDPAEAFEAVRRELSLLHHAVEGLTAARQAIPDYSETLGRIGQMLGSIGARLAHLESRPALDLSPEAMAQQIHKAAQDVRAEDRRTLHEARDALSRSLGHVDGMVKRGQASNRQSASLIRVAVCASLLGILLWSFLPGTIARALPESWHVPEWMAARTIGLEQQAAGERMIAAASKAKLREQSSAAEAEE